MIKPTWIEVHTLALSKKRWLPRWARRLVEASYVRLWDERNRKILMLKLKLLEHQREIESILVNRREQTVTLAREEVREQMRAS